MPPTRRRLIFLAALAAGLLLCAIASGCLPACAAAPDAQPGFDDLDTDGDGTVDTRVVHDFDGDGTLKWVDDFLAAVDDFCDPDHDGTQNSRHVTGEPAWCGAISADPGTWHTSPGARTRAIPWSGMEWNLDGVIVDQTDVSCAEIGDESRLAPIQIHHPSVATGPPWTGRYIRVRGVTVRGTGSRDTLDPLCNINRIPTITDCSSGHWCPRSRIVAIDVQGYDDVVVENTRVENVDAGGIYVQYGDGVVIRNNTVIGVGEHAFALNTVQNGTITVNRGQHTGRAGGDCIVLAQDVAGTGSAHVEISQNVCTDTQIGVQFETYNGSTGATDVTVADNSFTSADVLKAPCDVNGDGSLEDACPTVGVYANSGEGSSLTGIHVLRNTFNRFQGQGMLVNDLSGSRAHNADWLVSDNQFEHCVSADSNLSGPVIQATLTESTIEDNSLVGGDGGTSLAHFGMYLDGAGSLVVRRNFVTGWNISGVYFVDTPGNSGHVVSDNTMLAQGAADQGVMVHASNAPVDVTLNYIGTASTSGTPATLDIGVKAGGTSNVIQNQIDRSGIAGVFVSTAAANSTISDNTIVASISSNCVYYESGLPPPPSNTCQSAPLPTSGEARSLVVMRSRASLVLKWEPSCLANDSDYEIYEGAIGNFSSTTPRRCTTGHTTTSVIPAAPGNRFYLVVPRNSSHEGSYGENSQHQERLPSTSACLPPAPLSCD